MREYKPTRDIRFRVRQRIISVRYRYFARRNRESCLSMVPSEGLFSASDENTDDARVSDASWDSVADSDGAWEVEERGAELEHVAIAFAQDTVNKHNEDPANTNTTSAVSVGADEDNEDASRDSLLNHSYNAQDPTPDFPGAFGEYVRQLDKIRNHDVLVPNKVGVAEEYHNLTGGLGEGILQTHSGDEEEEQHDHEVVQATISGLSHPSHISVDDQTGIIDVPNIKTLECTQSELANNDQIRKDSAIKARHDPRPEQVIDLNTSEQTEASEVSLTKASQVTTDLPMSFGTDKEDSIDMKAGGLEPSSTSSPTKRVHFSPEITIRTVPTNVANAAENLARLSIIRDGNGSENSIGGVQHDGLDDDKAEVPEYDLDSARPLTHHIQEETRQMEEEGAVSLEEEEEAKAEHDWLVQESAKLQEERVSVLQGDRTRDRQTKQALVTSLRRSILQQQSGWSIPTKC
jgi:hypothetical protein